MGDSLINKQNMLFLALSSLVLVLSVYYVTMPNELLLTTNNSNYSSVSSIVEKEKEEIVVSDSSVVSAMKNLTRDERLKEVEDLNNKLIDKTLSTEEKNNVYEEIKTINKLTSMEEELEKKIKEEFKFENFVKIKDDVIEVTINSSKHDKNLAVKIMSLVEKDYPNYYISVSFKA